MTNLEENMKKIITLVAAAAIAAAVFAAPTAVADQPLPKTQSTVLDDFEDGMYLEAVRDGWNAYGNVFMKTQFSTESSTTARWDKNGNCGQLDYAALPGNKEQACLYECSDLLETNWKNYKYMTIVVNNPNDYDVTVQLFTKTGDTWLWGNTDAVTIGSGVHTVMFTLSSATVKNPADVKQFGIAFYIGGAHPASKVFVDDIVLYK